jgi:membrane-associated phospholipid phosphatase
MRAKAGYAAFLLATGVVVALAVAVLAVGVLPGDVWARDMLLAHASPAVICAMRWIRHAGHARVLVPGTLLLIALSPRVRRWWWVWVALIVLAAISEWALKPVVGRVRPGSTAALGFPSGHAAAAAAYFGAVIYAATDLPPAARGVVRVAAAIMIVLVGLARILLNAHWPSDVLGGFAVGVACAIAAALISASIRRSPAGSTSPALPSRD